MNNNTLEIDIEAAGPQGLSAYEVALQNGFVGTEQEWLDSLKAEISEDEFKTINGESIVGQGNIEIGGGSGTSNYNNLTNKPKINNIELNENKTSSDLGLQDKLVSGTNIKTINGSSILGSGNLVIESGEGGLSSVAHDDTMTGDGTNASPLKVNTSKIAQKSDIPDTSEFITKSVNNLTNYTKTSDLGSLATKNTVNYETEVTNKPTIPSEVTETTVSGWGFTKNTGTYSKPSGGIPKSDLTSTVQASLNKADSALQEHQSLSNYYTKSEVDGKVSSVYKYKGTVATYSALPSTGLTIGDVYNVESDGSNYAWVGTVWDKLGGDIDLSNYQTKISSSDKLSSDLVDDTGKTNKFVTASEKTTWNSKYEKPSGGIPKSDLDSSVQASLSKADTALQTEQYTGTYSKPSGGIPKSDLASAVQTSLGKADTALQSYTEQYTGTITGIKMNGASKGTSGVVDLGTVITAHQDISGKEDKSNKVTSISSSSTDTEYPSAKAVYDLAIGNVDLSIPSYVKEEAESTLAKAFSHRNLGRTIRFIAVSDAHNDEGNLTHEYTQISNKHCGQAVKYISDRIGLDFVSFLGDATWAGVATVDNYADQLKDDIQQMNEFLSEGFRGIPNIRLVGNHDQIKTTDGYRIQNDGAYNFFGRYNAGNKVGNTNYGYYDIESQKVRVIYLNTSDSTNSTAAGTLLAMSQDQKNWLCETLIDVNTKTDASSWKIILMSHAPLDFASFNIDTALLVAYTNGGTYGNYTFTNHDAKIICNFHGHIHSYSYGYIQGKIRRATIPNSNFYDNNHYKSNPSYAQWTDTTTYPKTMNSRTDTAFSLVTIDLDNEICYIDNYGAGIDRTFSVSYKKTVTGISNASYSGATTVGSAIDPSAISYTLTYADSTTATLSGDVTVDPSTIASVGDNSVTVTYTEAGTTFTTALTIVGTPVPVVNMIDLNRTYETIPTDDSVGNHLDDTKGYLNVAYGTGKGYSKSCKVADVTSTGFTVTEAGVGGIAVAIPIKVTNINKTYTLTFDYSGAGKCRTYYRYAKSASGEIRGSSTAYVNDTAGTSGTATVTIPDAYNNYGAGTDWLILSFTSNTGATKSFTNVSLVENN